LGSATSGRRGGALAGPNHRACAITRWGAPSG
jgi:hypothetical protein